MKTVILGSGKGTNAEAIIHAQSNQLLGNAEVHAIFSDNEDSGILKVAESNNIDGYYLDGGALKTNFDERTEQVWIEEIMKFDPDLIVLAGFMRVLKPAFIKAFNGAIVNLHPSLLPSFKGLRAIERAFDYGVKISGCSVHWVSEEIDSGKIIGQAPVRIMEGDTIDMVSQKIHAVEHMLLPSVIQNLSIGALPFPEA
jgi:phosphoribosylglycinamide formyltransferase 1